MIEEEYRELCQKTADAHPSAVEDFWRGLFVRVCSALGVEAAVIPVEGGPPGGAYMFGLQGVLKGYSFDVLGIANSYVPKISP